MRGPIRRAIDDGHYNLGFVWDRLNEGERSLLLHWMINLSSYGSKAHMGMLPLVSLKTAFEIMNKAEDDGYSIIPNTNVKQWPRGPSVIHKMKTIIRFAVADDLRLKKKLERKQARERRMRCESASQR